MLGNQSLPDGNVGDIEIRSWAWLSGVNKRLKILGCIACFTAVLVLNGGQWMALQSFAWVRMTVQFFQQDSLGVAIAKTFSGRYPCSLCLKVQSGLQEQKQEEQKLPWLQTERLPEAVWEWRCLLAPPVPTASAEEPDSLPSIYLGYAERPPTPPPRA